ncbi:MAG: hypothetical protein NWR30_04685 [Salibacteraceae bacterium]|nr:hypothetical protein [Salibacteraceae bacterium]
MKRQITFLISVFLLLFFSAKSQTEQASFRLQFVPMFGDSIATTSEIVSAGNNNYHLSKCRFYLSNFQFFDADQKLISTESQAYLLDIEDPQSLIIITTKPKNATYIMFGVGIDSINNVSGAMGGALDPTKGMYWSWQSGYINVKLEGNFNGPHIKKFEYHLGGYAGENACYNTSAFIPISDTLNIGIALSEFLNQAEAQETFKIMSPSATAAKLSKVFAALFQPLNP